MVDALHSFGEESVPDLLEVIPHAVYDLAQHEQDTVRSLAYSALQAAHSVGTQKPDCTMSGHDRRIIGGPITLDGIEDDRDDTQYPSVFRSGHAPTYWTVLYREYRGQGSCLVENTSSVIASFRSNLSDGQVRGVETARIATDTDHTLLAKVISRCLARTIVPTEMLQTWVATEVAR